MSDKIKFNMDKGLYTGMVLIDLQKAFDTVDHTILLQKLKAVGAEDRVVHWFKSYLTDRQQIVDINGVHSSPQHVTYGVPQGSILGPLLFLIYVNDMSTSVSCDLFLYADDSALMVSGKSVRDIESQLCKELHSMSEWLVSNKLSLHLGKTESILFGSKKKLKSRKNMNIVCNGNVIVAKDSVKYLGAIIDQDMSGRSMGVSAIKKINKGLKFMYRKKDFFDTKCRKMLCQSLLQSHFDYACNSWYRNLEKCLKIKLQCAQNKIFRYVLQYDNRHHITCSDFQIMKCLNVKTRVDYLSLSAMFNIFHKTAPVYMCNDVSLVSHSHNTRHSKSSFVVINAKTQGQNSFLYNGIKLWNDLPVNIKDECVKRNFKVKCKKYLMNKMCREEESDFTV